MTLESTHGLAVLVGGAGFVGTALTEALARAGWRIRIVSRNPGRGARLKPLGDPGQIDSVRGDLRVPASLEAAFKGAEAVVNLVGILDEKSGQKFAEVQARGAASAAQIAARQGVSGFVQVSAIGADPASPSAYGRSKAEGETAVRAAIPGAAVIRPSLVFGADDGFTNRFAKLIAMAPLIPVVAPETRFQPVYVQDVAQAILTVLQRMRDGQPGGIHELGGPEILTMRQIMAYIAAETGNGAKAMIDTPDFGARLLAALGPLPGAPLTRDQYLMLKRDNVTSPGTPGLADLGIVPTPLSAVAPQWLARYRTGGRFASTTAG
ncbi:MAG: complex I NDUFA9 subunit family protein [Sandaracinobacteroides sp.]